MFELPIAARPLRATSRRRNVRNTPATRVRRAEDDAPTPMRRTADCASPTRQFMRRRTVHSSCSKLRADCARHRGGGTYATHQRRASEGPKMMRRRPCGGLRTPSPTRDSLHGVVRSTQAVQSCAPTARVIVEAKHTQRTSDARPTGRRRCADAHAADCGLRQLQTTAYAASYGPPKLP